MRNTSQTIAEHHHFNIINSKCHPSCEKQQTGGGWTYWWHCWTFSWRGCGDRAGLLRTAWRRFPLPLCWGGWCVRRCQRVHKPGTFVNIHCKEQFNLSRQDNVMQKIFWGKLVTSFQSLIWCPFSFLRTDKDAREGLEFVISALEISCEMICTRRNARASLVSVARGTNSIVLTSLGRNEFDFAVRLCGWRAGTGACCRQRCRKTGTRLLFCWWITGTRYWAVNTETHECR